MQTAVRLPAVSEYPALHVVLQAVPATQVNGLAFVGVLGLPVQFSRPMPTLKSSIKSIRQMVCQYCTMYMHVI
jgi:hypothetical protein